jgi:TetR/AcrR family transcriptional regulator, regulator of autoinduction and epiphytic fitness
VLSVDPLAAARPAGTASGSRPPAVDGRTARGARARTSIAEALISLLQEGVTRPTARQVAEQAGVSLRLVFHHFEDMESLLESAVDVQVERHWKSLEVVSSEGDLLERVKATVNQRARLFNAIAPVRRAAAQAACGSPTLARQLDSSRSLLRSRLRQTFSPELSMQIYGPSLIHRELLDALEVATSFETWDQLRRHAGRSTSATRQVVERLVLGVFGQTRPAEQKSPTAEPDRTTEPDRSRQ